MQVDVWSDLVCPWCCIGRARLASVLRDQVADGVSVVWRSFELDPSTPATPTEPVSGMLARKYGWSADQVEAAQARVTGLAAAEGMALRLDRTWPQNTFHAHRVTHLALTHGRQTEVVDALMRAYFVDGRRIGEAEVQREVAVGAGIPADDVDRVLGDPAAYADAVRTDEAEARRLGIRGVPFFVFAGRFAVSGAQPTEVLADALAKAAAFA